MTDRLKNKVAIITGAGSRNGVLRWPSCLLLKAQRLLLPI